MEFITPYLIFAMLLLTFCKIKPSEMKVSFMHLWLLLIQILGSVAAYYLFYPLGKVVAESVMVCVIAPTATASAVITAKLGGSAASLAAYTLLSNLGTAMAVPIIFPLVEENAELGFLVLSMRIFSKVFPLLICRGIKRVTAILVYASLLQQMLRQARLSLAITRKKEPPVSSS